MCDDGGKNVKVQVDFKLVGIQDLLLVHAASDNVQDVFFLELRWLPYLRQHSCRTNSPLTDTLKSSRISDFIQTLHSQRLISDYEKVEHSALSWFW